MKLRDRLRAAVNVLRFGPEPLPPALPPRVINQGPPEFDGNWVGVRQISEEELATWKGATYRSALTRAQVLLLGDLAARLRETAPRRVSLELRWEERHLTKLRQHRDKPPESRLAGIEVSLHVRSTVHALDRICEFCDHQFPEHLGRYGCPNCNGEV